MTIANPQSYTKKPIISTILIILFTGFGISGLGYFYVKKYVLGMVFLVFTPITVIGFFFVWIMFIEQPMMYFSDYQSFVLLIQMRFDNFVDGGGLHIVYGSIIASAIFQIIHTRKLCHIIYYK